MQAHHQQLSFPTTQIPPPNTIQFNGIPETVINTMHNNILDPSPQPDDKSQPSYRLNDNINDQVISEGLFDIDPVSVANYRNYRARLIKLRMFGCSVLGLLVRNRLRFTWRNIQKTASAKSKRASAIRRIFNHSIKNIKAKVFIALKNKAPSKPVFLRSAIPELGQQPWTAEQTSKLLQVIKSDLQSGGVVANGGCNRTEIQLRISHELSRREVKDLRDHIDTLTKRLERENDKKGESLKMLAQELEEKNEIIEDLMRSLAFYESKYQPANNILDSDIQTIKKELEQSQKIRARLEDDLNSSKQKIQSLTQKLKQATSKILELQKQQSEHKSLIFENKVKNEKLEKTSHQLEKLIDEFKTKLKKATYETASPSNPSAHKLKEIQAVLKLSVLVDYLSGLNFEQPLSHHLFTHGEVEAVEVLRNEWRELKRKADSNTDRVKESNDLSNIVGHGVKKNHMSVLDMLDSHNHDHHQDQPDPEKPSGITMKIMEIEIEKNRLSGQISELKAKIMHIRDIVLNLLKLVGREIDLGKKSDAASVVELILEFFQYSEQERQCLLSKKKKMFGIF